MKNQLLNHFDKIILSLLAILGFAACEPMAEYGTPSAEFIIKGTVTDSVSSIPIPNIRIIRGDSTSYSYPLFDTIYTDATGKYEMSVNAFPVESPTFQLKADDIDGTQHGGDFQSKTVQVVFTSTDWTETKSTPWFVGKAQKTVDFKLRKK